MNAGLPRLATDCLQQLGSEVVLPAYDRSALRPGMVHLGVGAFHRAHQAWLTDLALQQEWGDWGIIGVSLRSDRVARQLNPQHGLFSLSLEQADSAQLQVVGSLLNVLVAPQQIEEVVAAIAAPAIHIVTLTITEKGYCLLKSGSGLDVSHKDIAADLEQPLQPGTAIGLLALGLRQRMHGAATPVTVISCDNLLHNGQALQQALSDYLELCFPEVLPWLQSSVTFPNSMVDRIVPASSEELVRTRAQGLGAEDEAAVSTEVFWQWVIEDRFAGPRPAWQRCGVELVGSVAPYEAMKLGVLNAAHSAIAWLGRLQGLETVDQVMADPDRRALIERLMRTELAAAVSVPESLNVQDYITRLLVRFANPGLHHRCAQIAIDSSEKIIQRWLPALCGTQPTPLLEQMLGLWLYAVLMTDLSLDDPAVKALLQQRTSQADLQSRIQAVLLQLGVHAVQLSDFEALCERLKSTVDRLQSSQPDTLAAFAVDYP